jgi:hypothetical protein
MPLTGLRRGFASILVSTVIPGGVLLAQAPGELHGVYTIRQESSERYLDAYATPDRDYGVVTRVRQENRFPRFSENSTSDKRCARPGSSKEQHPRASPSRHAASGPR